MMTISRIAHRFQLNSILQNANLSHDSTQAPFVRARSNPPRFFHFARTLDDNITENRGSVNRLHQKRRIKLKNNGYMLLIFISDIHSCTVGGLFDCFKIITMPII